MCGARVNVLLLKRVKRTFNFKKKGLREAI